MNFFFFFNRFATKPRKTVFLLKFKRTYNSQHHKQKKRPENQCVNSKFVDPQGKTPDQLKTPLSLLLIAVKALF